MEPGLLSRVLIMGGGGMLAQAAAAAVVRRGGLAIPITKAQCDVSDAAQVEAAIAAHRPTLLLNCAAFTKVDLCETQEALALAVNGEGPGHLARACARTGALLVHVSTDYVFDGEKGRPYLPDDAVNPQSAYGRSKLLGERRVRESGLARYLIVRTSGLYGRSGACFPRVIISNAKAGKQLKVVKDQVTCPTYVPDLAEAMLDLALKNASGLFHVCNREPVSWFDFSVACLEAWGLPVRPEPVTTEAYRLIRPGQAPRPRHSVLDVTATEDVIGRPMRSWREALADFRRDGDILP